MFSYATKGVCSRKITFDIVDGKLHNVQFEGGCPGNLLAISKLVEGKDALEIAELLAGNDCRGRGTSCADQLSHAIKANI
ncbi:TIGR03905 family TSCPD domain-containing protein [uncultured Phascolarctobacterium sp.]|uniref:TIGR03905 family TSCPD domain-containing protein n=1 Tax=uncultured Phascolarctobacterium sp. TaxID=512296 RepID=UPI0025E127AE|nr:TIGR03905 family TSCPD domain-containing protein [uncultured Phascolarctobacterium sp.]